MLFVAQHLNAASLVVQPNKLYLTARPGTTIEQLIAISSLDGRDVPVRLSIEAFSLDRDGRPTHRPSAPDWIRLPQSGAVIPANAPLPLRLRFTVPDDAEGTLWCALMLDTPRESRVRTRIAIPVFLTAAGTERPRAAIEDVRAVSVTNAIVVSARIRNTGNTVLRSPVAAAIEDGRQTEIASAENPDFVILPGGVRAVEMRFDGPFDDPGALIASVFYRCSDSLLSATAKVTRSGTESL